MKVGNKTLATYEYAPNNGNLTKMTYGNGDTVEYTYDIFDRIIEEKYNNGTKYKYVYNGEGVLSKKLELDSNEAVINVVNYEYDGLGRLIHSSEERSEDNNLSEVQRSEHMYDGENRISSQSSSIDGGEMRQESYTYNKANGLLEKMTTATGEQLGYSYDGLQRLVSVSTVRNNNEFLKQTYEYRTLKDNVTTNQVEKVSYSGLSDSLSYAYTYDAVGNISSIKQGNTTIAEYAYDIQNQLIEENLPTQKLKYEYIYDTCGNIRQVNTYRNGSTTAEVSNYGYTDSDWTDLLTAYNGQALKYDEIGNPLTYNNGTAWTFEWQKGRQLVSAVAEGKSISYTYDMDGVRDSKTVNGIKHEYITQGGNVTLDRWNDGEAKSLEYIYDNSGSPYSVIYTHGNTSETYYYILNQQGDVVRIVDTNGATVAEYSYNSWGEILNVTKANENNIGDLNSLRYRSYFYDAETGLYYLQNRYYDPIVKRMLNADAVGATQGKLGSENMFSYSGNNPVNNVDATGNLFGKLKNLAKKIKSAAKKVKTKISKAYSKVKSFVKKTFSISTSRSSTRYQTKINYIAFTWKRGSTLTYQKRSSSKARININYDVGSSWRESSASINYSHSKGTFSVTHGIGSIEFSSSRDQNDKEKTIAFDYSLPQFSIGITSSTTTQLDESASNTDFCRLGITPVLPILVFVSAVEIPVTGVAIFA